MNAARAFRAAYDSRDRDTRGGMFEPSQVASKTVAGESNID